MKKLFYYIFVLGFSILLDSCKKDINSLIPLPAFDIELLRQKWTWVSTSDHVPAYPEKNQTYLLPNGSYSDFRTDSKVYNYFPPHFDTSGYFLKDSILSFYVLQNGQKIDSSNAKILTLNSNTLIFSFPSIYYVEDTLTGIETIYAGEVLDSLKR